MKICRPFKNASVLSITNGFSQEHQANDFSCKFGEFLVAVCNSKVLSIVGIESDMDEPDMGSLSNGYGIRLQSTEDPTITYTYWHCQGIFGLKKGDIILQGQVVAMGGNSGFVLSNGELVEVDRKLIAPFPGTHLHWSMGKNNPDGTYTALDPSKLISWEISINYSIIDTISLFLKSIFNFLKK